MKMTLAHVVLDAVKQTAAGIITNKFFLILAPL